MAEKLHVEIFIDKSTKLGQKDYVQGNIHGMMRAICETYDDKRFGLREYEAGMFMNTYATVEEYVKLKTKIESAYKDVCRISIHKICEE